MIGKTIGLAGPLGLSALASAFAALVERQFLSQHSEVAVAAVLPGDVLAGTFAALVVATVSYSSAFVARFHGAGQGERAVASFAQGLWLVVASIPLFALAVPLGSLYLDHTGHAAELVAAEKSFFSIVVPSGVLTALGAVEAGFFLGRGRARLVAVVTVMSCLAELALVKLFVFGAGPLAPMGVAGAGWARVASAAFMALALLPAVWRDKLVRDDRAALGPDFGLARRLIAQGLPEGFKSFVGSLVFLAFVTVAGRLDAAALAVGSVCFAVNNLIGTVVRAIASATAILVGQRFGAADRAGMSAAVRAGLALAAAATVAFFGFVIPFSGGLARTLYWVFLLRGLCEGAYLVLDSALKGVGDTRFTMTAEIAAELFVWAPAVALVLGYSSSVVLLYLTMPLWLAVGAVAFAVRWRGERWRNRARV